MKLWTEIVCRSAIGLLVAGVFLAWTGSFWWALGALLGTGILMNTLGNRRNWSGHRGGPR